MPSSVSAFAKQLRSADSSLCLILGGLSRQPPLLNVELSQGLINLRALAEQISEALFGVQDGVLSLPELHLRHELLVIERLRGLQRLIGQQHALGLQICSLGKRSLLSKQADASRANVIALPGCQLRLGGKLAINSRRLSIIRLGYQGAYGLATVNS